MKQFLILVDTLFSFSMMGVGLFLCYFAMTHGAEQGSLQIWALGIILLGVGNLVGRLRP